MNYHIFETYTLSSMLIDINKEISSIDDRLKRLNEEREIIQLIIKHRKTRNNKIDDDTLIDPK